jgi:membrane protease YdiL (CAAX protease family)
VPGGINEAVPKPLSETQRTWNEIKHEVGLFAAFVRKPRRTLRGEKKWLSRFLLLWGLCLAVAILQIPLEIGFEQFAPSIKYTLNTDTRFMLMAVFIAPLLEELAFRAGLRSARYTLFVGPALFLVVRAGSTLLAVAVAAGFALIGLLDWLHSRYLARPGLAVRRGRAFLRRYPLVVWIYAAAFAVIHIGNFEYSQQAAFLMPLVLLPQLFCGLVFSYLRIRHGLRYSILLHAAYNASLCSVLLLG